MANPIRLLLTDVDPPRFAERLRRCDAAEGFEFIVPEEEGEEALCARAPEAEAILCYKEPLPGSAIRAARQTQTDPETWAELPQHRRRGGDRDGDSRGYVFLFRETPPWPNTHWR